MAITPAVPKRPLVAKTGKSDNRSRECVNLSDMKTDNDLCSKSLNRNFALSLNRSNPIAAQLRLPTLAHGTNTWTTPRVIAIQRQQPPRLPSTAWLAIAAFLRPKGRELTTLGSTCHALWAICDGAAAFTGEELCAILDGPSEEFERWCCFISDVTHLRLIGSRYITTSADRPLACHHLSTSVDSPDCCSGTSSPPAEGNSGHSSPSENRSFPTTVAFPVGEVSPKSEVARMFKRLHRNTCIPTCAPSNSISNSVMRTLNFARLKHVVTRRTYRIHEFARRFRALESICVSGVCRPHCVDPVTEAVARSLVCSENLRNLRVAHFWSFHTDDSNPPIEVNNVQHFICGDQTDSHHFRCPNVISAHLELQGFKRSFQSVHDETPLITSDEPSGKEMIDYDKLLKSFSPQLKHLFVSFPAGLEPITLLRTFKRSRRRAAARDFAAGGPPNANSLASLCLNGIDLSELPAVLGSIPPTRTLGLSLTNNCTPSAIDVRDCLADFFFHNCNQHPKGSPRHHRQPHTPLVHDRKRSSRLGALRRWSVNSARQSVVLEKDSALSHYRYENERRYEALYGHEHKGGIFSNITYFAKATGYECERLLDSALYGTQRGVRPRAFDKEDEPRFIPVSARGRLESAESSQAEIERYPSATNLRTLIMNASLLESDRGYGWYLIPTFTKYGFSNIGEINQDGVTKSAQSSVYRSYQSHQQRRAARHSLAVMNR